MATSTQIKQFIQKLGTLAVAECNRRIANGQGFVLPSVCIAQSAIETGWGTAGIMVKANAYFGIKAGGSWTGKVYRADTWEVADGSAYNTTANFRAYDSLADSVKDYFDLISGLSRYSNALSYGSDKSQWKTPKATITAIWAGGYATDTLYVEKIMNTINSRNLTAYDDLITGEGELNVETSVFTYTSADLLQGVLTPADSNRTYVNDTSVLTSVALDWSKAFQPVTSGTFKIHGLGDNYRMNLRRVISDTYGDSVLNDTEVYVEGGTVHIDNREHVAFEVYHVDGNNLTPSDFDGVTFEFNSLPEGEEIEINGIAFFVKIE